MNNYKIYLTDPNGNNGELDCEGLDVSTIFSVSELSDISVRKEKISKTINIKGTKKNNEIFGSLFNLNRVTNTDNPLRLFFNYSAAIPVDCLVYENSILLYKGNLRVLSVNSDSKGIITYEVIITGYLINFYANLGDLNLENLDFSDYQHTFRLSNIESSWSTGIVKNGVTVPFAYGKGYVYPFIDHGDKSSPLSGDVNKIHYSNFRPAIYVREYFNKIFQQNELGGFSYELKGSNDFINDFDRLIIPNNTDILTTDYAGDYAVTLTKTGNTNGINNARITSGVELKRAIPFTSIQDTLNLITQANFNNENNNIFKWDRNINGDAEIKVNISISNGGNPSPLTCYLRLAEREIIPIGNGDYNNLDKFSSIQEKQFAVVLPNTSFPASDVSLIIPNTSFSPTKEFILLLHVVGANNGFTSTYLTINIGDAVVKLPSVPTNKITYDVTINDVIQPLPPVAIKQKDFIKSVINMFNLYVYTDTDNPKKIIFEKYNDYYSLATPAYLKNNSIDLTEKIDYSKNFKIITYNELAKKYSFNFKDDTDYYNDILYKKRYGVTYGSFTAVDSLGSGEEKKIDLIFSPTPITKYNNTNRIQPAIYKLESNNSRTPIKSNIRIMYYNGLKSCIPYQIGTMSVNGTNYLFEPYITPPLQTSPTFTTYPQVGHIRYNDGLDNIGAKSDLNFGLCKEYFCGVDTTIYNLSNLFTDNYKSQLLEMSNTDNIIVECSVMLNEVDISNLNLKVPVFIDTPNGNAYFKIINIEYSNNSEPSSIQLQKINF